MAIASSLGQTAERMDAGVGAIDGIDSMLSKGRATVEERLRAHIDDHERGRPADRSDNQALASTIPASSRRSRRPSRSIRSSCMNPCAP